MAIRPVSAAKTEDGRTDSKAGRARQAPRPRRKRRRLRLAYRCAAMSRRSDRLVFIDSVFGLDPGLRRSGIRRGGTIPSFLERIRFDDAHQHGGKASVLPVESRNDPVNRLDI